MSHHCSLCQKPDSTLREIDDILGLKLDEEEQKIKEESRRRMVEKGGSVRHPDHRRTGTDETGAIVVDHCFDGGSGCPLVISSKVLNSTSVVRGSKQIPQINSSSMEKETEDTLISGSRISKLPPEILKMVYDHIDVNESYGRGALALTCKKMAANVDYVKINKTQLLMEHLSWMGDSQWCNGCLSPRSFSRQFWEKQTPHLKEFWDTMSHARGPFERIHEIVIGKWLQPRAPDNLPPLGLYHCPTCQHEWKWTGWEAIRLKGEDNDWSRRIGSLKMRQKEIEECIDSRK